MNAKPKYVTRKISRETAGEWGLPYDLSETEEHNANYPKLALLIDNDEGDHARWYSTYTLVFRAPDDRELWACDYYADLTEYQDIDAWDYQEEIVLTKVKPVQLTVVKYAKVREE
jgi:hypothetical protein